MIIKESKLFSTLDQFMDQYKVVKEADENPFPEEPTEDEDGDAAENEDISLDDLGDIQEDGTEEDPTETPAPDDIPNNEKGEYISDTKLAMFANTLLKAYQAKPPASIPNELLNVSAANANEVIKFIEDSLTLDKPTNDITSDLTKI